MRIPYAPSKPAESAPSSTRETYQRIASRRHPRPLIPLDLALLHSPTVADGYNAFVGALRNSTRLPADTFELAVCRVAVLTNAVYEWEAHSELAAKAGVSGQLLQAILTVGSGGFGVELEGRWEDVVDEVQRTVLNYVDQVTIANQVDDAVWEALQHAFEKNGWRERELVELTVTIAGYNAVSRILVPLNVAERNGSEMKIPSIVDQEEVTVATES